ncbi:hypothetical protein H1C71_010302, partial [Ictidomys tridecemlineatus]
VLYPCCEAEEAWPQDQLPLSPAPCPCLYPQPGAEEAPALSSQEIKAACAVDSRESKARRQWIKELGESGTLAAWKATHPSVTINQRTLINCLSLLWLHFWHPTLSFGLVKGVSTLSQLRVTSQCPFLSRWNTAGL